jgi:glycosyltransferase involved in cell wall biosynthesis
MRTTSTTVCERTVLLIRNANTYDFGGAERFPLFVATVLKREYGNPIVVSCSSKLLDQAEDAGIDTIHGMWWGRQQWSGIRVLLFPLYVCWQLILFFWYLRLFMRLRPNVVHIQSKDDFIAATYAARMVGSNTIWTDHADLKHIWQNLRVWYKNPVGKWVYRAAKHADAITVISKSEYREVTQHLPVKSAIIPIITIINNGSPDLKDSYHHSPNEVFTFCSTNRLVSDKGIDEMISAFKRFHKKHANSQLILVGNGPEEKRFQSISVDTPSIIFVGYQQDPLSFVASCHVLLQPTYHEGFSISILEAFMMERAVIATSVGGNLEMVSDHKTGILIPSKDSSSLLNAMELLFNDSDLRNKIAKNGRKNYLKNYVFDTIVREKYMRLYEKPSR